jgi:hypothetical protein
VTHSGPCTFESKRGWTAPYWVVLRLQVREHPQVRQTETGGETMTDYCQMCGARKGLRLANDPSGQRKTLCALCARGSAELIAEKQEVGK